MSETIIETEEGQPRPIGRSHSKETEEKGEDMARGDGSITERLNPATGKSYTPRKWRVVVSFGTNPATGKLLQVVRHVTGTKADARKVRDEIRKERETGIRPDTYRTTFKEFSDGWRQLRRDRGEVSARTLEDDEFALRGLNERLGAFALRDITPAVVEKTLAAIKRGGKGRSGGGLSGTTMHRYYVKLNQVMQHAVDNDLIARNPCDRVKAPRPNKPKRRALSAGELARLDRELAAWEAEERSRVAEKEGRRGGGERSAVRGLGALGKAQAVRIGKATGARVGEVLALRWRNVSLSKGSIFITESITNKGAIKAPKTDAGTRTVALDADTVAHLVRWRGEQAALLFSMGCKQTPDTPVCCSDVGGYIGVGNFETWFARFRKRAGFEGLRFHELRHTQATLLLANGVDVKTVQTRLGHSSASVTLDWYAKALPENDRKAADLMGSLASKRPFTPAVVTSKTA